LYFFFVEEIDSNFDFDSEMNNSNKVKSYIDKELKQGVEVGTSWHNDVRNI